MTPGPIKVTIDVGGEEVAKWLRRIAASKWQGPGTAVAPGIVVTAANAPIYRNLGESTDAAYIGWADVQFMVLDDVFSPELDWDDNTDIAAEAVTAVNEATNGMLKRVELMQVGIDRR